MSVGPNVLRERLFRREGKTLIEEVNHENTSENLSPRICWFDPFRGRDAVAIRPAISEDQGRGQSV